MAIRIVAAHDATTQNYGHLPPGQACGYTTGGPTIEWTTAQWDGRPGAVRICQDAGATDRTADILDVEQGAATYADCPGWVKAAVVNYDNVARAGQRWPAIYCSANNVTAVVNALAGGGVTSGAGLWIANWNLTESQAVDAVQAAAGPFPIIGIQWSDAAGYYDDDIFDAGWIGATSAPPDPHHTGPTHHNATGLDSLAAICERRSVPLQRAIWLTAEAYSRGFGLEQREYFNHGDMSRHMPVGMPYVLP